MGSPLKTTNTHLGESLSKFSVKTKELQTLFYKIA